MDSKVKALLRKLMPGKAIDLLSSVYSIRSNPYTLKSALVVPDSISDFFVWNPNIAKTEFIAENLRSLLTGKEEEVVHCFKFFSDKGNFICEERHPSSDFFSRCILNGPNKSNLYCSFVHYVLAHNSIQKLIGIESVRNSQIICEQNRGYCIYYPNLNSVLGSSVHGNFGGIARNGTLLARKRALHLYTPTYRFDSRNSYDLVFNNPTKTSLNVKIFFNDKEELHESLKINSLATKCIHIDSYSGSITFESRLPVCRPVLFKNPDKANSGNFDVFHT